MKKHYKLLILLCAFCIILTLATCNHQEKYRPLKYTKEEIKRLYYENIELFETLVEVIISNDMFYEKGRINEYADADIVSPYDDALTFFEDTDRKTIDEFFDLKPYMILYDYARRFVAITFIASDINDESYTFLFWTSNVENGEEKFDDYKFYLTQHNILENIDSQCIMYYCNSIIHKHN